MSTIVQIDSVVNSLDGSTVVVTASGAPTGTLTFAASRTPDGPKSVCSYTGAGPYIVTLPHASLWYIWAHDNNGYSAPAAVWMSLSDEGLANQIGEKLEEILLANQIGLEARIQPFAPGVRIKTIKYGFPNDILSYPAVAIVKPRFTSEYIGSAYLKKKTFTFDISFILQHSDEQGFVEYAADFADAGMEIINQPAYETITLPSGIVISFCQAVNGDADDFDMGDSYYAVGSCVWSGEIIIQDAGN